jgi:hypothetical protein
MKREKVVAKIRSHIAERRRHSRIDGKKGEWFFVVRGRVLRSGLSRQEAVRIRRSYVQEGVF